MVRYEGSVPIHNANRSVGWVPLNPLYSEQAADG